MGKNTHITSLLSVMLLAAGAFGQETTGGIQGTVKDPQGAVVPGATVDVGSPALIGKKTTTTNSSGFYHIEQLPPGVYSITVTAAGFAPQSQTNLQLNAGALPTINVALKVGGVTQDVIVAAELETIDITQSKVQTNVPQATVDALPKGRSFQSLIPLAPGARQEPLKAAEKAI